jgi:hypothetical protein
MHHQLACPFGMSSIPHNTDSNITCTVGVVIVNQKIGLHRRRLLDCDTVIGRNQHFVAIV